VLASNSERDEVLRRLRAGHAHGLLGLDTFEARVDATLRATRRAELSALVLDLPTRAGALRDAMTAFLRRPSPAGTVEVTLPAWTDPPVVVGRSRACDVRLAEDDTVSARHLELRPLDDRDRWLLLDLGSLNGTWFTGRRVARTVVRAGDRLLVGHTAVTLVAP
jgi:Domain of unknown function (DUF1707)/FHA domain